MEYVLKGEDGKVKRYEVSYSQVLQQKTNRLLTSLLVLLIILLAVLAYVLIKIDIMNIPTKMIGG